MILTSDLLGDLASMKDVWKSVSMRLGVPSVMAPGQLLMPMLSADNWGMLPQVNKIYLMVGLCTNISLNSQVQQH